jgi:hypothetical protein
MGRRTGTHCEDCDGMSSLVMGRRTGTHCEDCDGMSSLVMGRRTGTHCEDYDGMTYQNMDPSDVEFSKIQNNRKISQNHIQHDSLNQIHDLPLPPKKKINPSFISKCLPLSYKTINNNFFHCFKDFWILS